jgi:peptidoglycan/xylan/chitin deacetylase (PgdA/CDA1 family)
VGGGAKGSIEVEAFRRHVEAVARGRDGVRGFNWLDDRPTADIGDDVWALFTFDDGYRDNFEFAAPILEDAGMRAVFFVTSGFVEGEVDITRNFRYYHGLEAMSWDNVHELGSRGHAIGLHGHKHVSLRRLNQGDVRREIERSIDLLRERTAFSTDLFALPFGQPEDWPDVGAFSWRDFGIRHIFTTENRRADLGRIDSTTPSAVWIPRISVDPDDDVRLLVAKIHGRSDYAAYVQRARGYYRRWRNS